MFYEIESEVSHLLRNSSYRNLIAELRLIVKNNSVLYESESRIKSIPSIFDSIYCGDQDENSVGTVRDLVGFRFWINCNTIDEFPDKMLTLIESIMEQTSFVESLQCIRMIEMNDHPHQKISLYFLIQEVNVEVQVKNLMLKSAYDRTIYPMWQGNQKNRFESSGIPSLFGTEDRTKLWNIICRAVIDESIQLPIITGTCACIGKCKLRNQASLINANDVKSRVIELSEKYGGRVLFA
jgi:hypothetical protein